MRRISKTALVAAIAAGWPTAAYAQALASTKLVTGTKALIADATLIITGLLAGAAAIAMLGLFLKGIFTVDEHEKAAVNRKLRSVGIMFAVALSISGLLTAVASYFQ